MALKKIGILLFFAFIICSFALSCANHGKFYVYSNRKGCVPVQNHSLCPASELNPKHATNLDDHVKDMQAILDSIEKENANNSVCIEAFKTAYCSKLTPKCFADGSVDFGPGNAACWKANQTCKGSFDFQGFCQSIPDGKQPFQKCILPSDPINGSCPQPEYKVINSNLL